MGVLSYYTEKYYTQQEIAESLGCSQATVCYWLKKYKMTSYGMRRRERWLTDLRLPSFISAKDWQKRPAGPPANSTYAYYTCAYYYLQGIFTHAFVLFLWITFSKYPLTTDDLCGIL